jgi:hypothetical protein
MTFEFKSVLGRNAKARYILPAIYLLIALLAWADFMRLPPDGLANIGLMIVIFPVMLLDLYLSPKGDVDNSVLVPDKWGYYVDYSIFFWVSVCILGIALYLLGRLIDRMISSN